MRFEVNVDDGNNLDTLNKARKAYNDTGAGKDGFTPAEDMSTFVQRLVDQAVGGALQPLGPTTLSAAIARIAQLEAELAKKTSISQTAVP